MAARGRDSEAARRPLPDSFEQIRATQAGVSSPNSVRRVEPGEFVTPEGGQGSSGVTISDVKDEERNGQPPERIPLPSGAS